MPAAWQTVQATHLAALTKDFALATLLDAAATDEPAVTPILLSIVIPSFNERANVAPMLAKLDAALGGIAWEAIYVDDDSPDGTADAVRAVAAVDRRVRCLQRLGRRGLSSAVVEGWLAASGAIVAVIDADLQHDETALPAMAALIRRDEADLVIATRYAAGGGIGDFAAARARLSRFGTWLAGLVIRHRVSDPMSGFFMMSRPLLTAVAPRLSSDGFKVLADVLANAPPATRIAEVPYTFRSRVHGTSKLDEVVLWDFGMFVAARLLGNRIPARFLSFAAIGASGVFTQFAAFAAGFNLLGLTFRAAETFAVLVAMVGNFLLNNALTYRDRRYRGWGMLRGLASYVALCGIGAVANVGVASRLFDLRPNWWPAVTAGIVVGTLWNYAATRLFTWSARRR